MKITSVNYDVNFISFRVLESSILQVLSRPYNNIIRIWRNAVEFADTLPDWDKEILIDDLIVLLSSYRTDVNFEVTVGPKTMMTLLATPLEDLFVEDSILDKLKVLLENSEVTEGRSIITANIKCPSLLPNGGLILEFDKGSYINRLAFNLGAELFNTFKNSINIRKA